MAPGCEQYSIGFGWFVVVLGAALAAFGVAAWLRPNAPIYGALARFVEHRRGAQRRQAITIRYFAPAVGAFWMLLGLLLVSEGVQCNRDYAAIHDAPLPKTAPR